MKAQLIESLIDEYLATSTAHEWQSDLVRRHHVLPLLWDWSIVFGLEPGGQVVSIEHGVESQTRVPVPDERLRNMALKQGSRTFPAIEGLIPQRPVNAKTCEGCAGRGIPEEAPIHLRDVLVCWCGGMGWLPASSAQMPTASKKKRPAWQFWRRSAG